jgi:HD-like signal output (HDOD) protein
MYEKLIQEYQGDFARGRTVDDVVDCVEDLPPMPDVIARALQLIDDLDATPDDLAGVIMLDAALASPILRLANSAGQGQQKEITTLSGAIMVVGLKQIKSMLYALALRKLNRNFGSTEKLVWQKSLGCASAAHVLCDKLRKRYRDELYLNGLLHNLGQFVLLSHRELGRLYADVLDRLRQHQEDFATAEREVLGFSHPLVGALVARKWGLPFSTCQAILRYADPFEGIAGEQDEIVATLKLSVDLGYFLGLGRPDGITVDNNSLDTLAVSVGFSPATLRADLSASMVQTKRRYLAEASAYN